MRRPQQTPVGRPAADLLPGVATHDSTQPSPPVPGTATVRAGPP